MDARDTDRETYEPPALSDLGAVGELTLDAPGGSTTDTDDG